MENTHNRAGGHVYPLEEMKKIKALAEERGLLVHVDGARICNAQRRVPGCRWPTIIVVPIQ